MVAAFGGSTLPPHNLRSTHMEPSQSDTASITAEVEKAPAPGTTRAQAQAQAAADHGPHLISESAAEHHHSIQVAAAVAGDAQEVSDEKAVNVVAPKAVLLPRAGTFDSAFTVSSSSAAAPSPLPILAARSDRVSLTKANKGDGGYVPAQGAKFENNLYHAVGFMELANAGDFAANVWNDEPVPVYATVFMAIGATAAGCMSIYAFMDSILAWRNVQFLRQQQRELKQARAQKVATSQSTRDVDVLLAVIYRELGSEAINRWGLDILMGSGAVLICIGTYLALGGENHRLWLASNILSGYLGNTPIAFFGLINSCWAFYIFCKAQGHVHAISKAIPGTRAAALVKRRSRTIQGYSTINGTATILGGVGSMLTATRWWGYVILIPVILSSIFCNFWWRWRIGYTRRELVAAKMPELDVEELTTALEFAARAEITIKEHAATPINPFVSDPTSLQQVLAFLVDHELLESFCVRLMKSSEMCASLCPDSDNLQEIHIDVALLLSMPEELHPSMIKTAQDLVRKTGSEHFRHRERYAAELLGTYLSVSQHESKSNKGTTLRREKGRLP